MSTRLPKYVSPLEPLRSALGDIGYKSLYQTLEPDMIRWTAEASDFIAENKKVYQSAEDDFVIKNNQLAWCKEFKMLECLSINGVPLTLKQGPGCETLCTDNCRSVCCGSDRTFSLNECYATFEPPLVDGSIVHGVFLKRPMGADGYPLVNDACKVAVAEYVKWKVCFLKADPRAASCEKRWYVLCVQARAKVNAITDEQLQEIGLMWH